MKGVLTGLKEFRKIAEHQERAGTKRKSDFLKLESGQSATLRFVQELDEGGKNYDEKMGVAISVFEHTNPEDFKQHFICTLQEEGKCVGCERKVVNARWKRRARMYINAYVKEEDAVKILATGFSGKGLANTLIEYFDDFGTLTDRWYKIKRQGEGLQTTYSLYPREIDSSELGEVTPVDLTNFTKYRDYNECVAFIDGEDAAPEEGSGKSDW